MKETKNTNKYPYKFDELYSYYLKSIDQASEEDSLIDMLCNEVLPFMCRNRFLPDGAGAEEDLISEVLFYLLPEIRKYGDKFGDSTNAGHFAGFMQRVVSCDLKTILTYYNRSMRNPEKSNLSLDARVHPKDSKSKTLLDTLATSEQEEDVNLSELASLLELSNISNLEKKVLACYLGGNSYKEGAVQCNTSEKSYGNALCRIKNKLKKIHLKVICGEQRMTQFDPRLDLILTAHEREVYACHSAGLTYPAGAASCGISCEAYGSELKIIFGKNQLLLAERKGCRLPRYYAMKADPLAYLCDTIVELYKMFQTVKLHPYVIRTELIGSQFRYVFHEFYNNKINVLREELGISIRLSSSRCLRT